MRIWNCKGSEILTCVLEFHITEYIIPSTNLPYYSMGNWKICDKHNIFNYNKKDSESI